MTTEKNTSIRPKKARKSLKMSANISRGIRGFLGGEMIQSGTFKFFPYLVFIAVLAFIYIANNYYAEDKIRLINQHRKELKQLRYEYITTKSELTSMTKQSQIAKKLGDKGIKESTDPIKTIQIKKEEK
jgi:hypothetical protein